MRRVHSVVLALMLAALLAACAPATPAPTEVPPTVTADPTNTLAPTDTLTPTLTPIPTETPTPVPTQEDFSDLHPYFTVKEAARETETVTREDFESGRLLREAKSRMDLQPFNPLVEAPLLSIVTGPTGVVYVKAGSHQYPQHPERIPSQIAAMYKFETGEVLIFQRVWTPSGDRYLSYMIDPSLNDPQYMTLEERFVLAPIIKPYGYDEKKDKYLNLLDSDLPLHSLSMKHYEKVRVELEAWVATKELSEELWRTPFLPSPN